MVRERLPLRKPIPWSTETASPGLATNFLLHPEAQEYYLRVKEKIDLATSSVCIQSFLFSKDSMGVVDSMEAAARRGISVRVIMDGMYPNPIGWLLTFTTRRYLKKLQKEGLPIEFVWPPVEKNEHYSMFQRDHTKNIIIDAEIPGKGVAFVGGRNIWSPDVRNRDCMVEMQGQAVQFAKQDFDATWQGFNNRAHSYQDTDGNLMVSDTRNTDVIPEMVLEKIKNAKHHIWIRTPYYDRVLLSEELIRLKKANPTLDIRFMTPLPESNNHLNYKISSPFYMNELAENNILVYGYKEGDNLLHHQFDHSKVILADDEAIVGSSNFSQLAMLGGQNAEIELFTKNTDLVAQLEQYFQEDFAKSVLRVGSQPSILDFIYRRIRRKDPKFT